MRARIFFLHAFIRALLSDWDALQDLNIGGLCPSSKS